MLLWPTRLFKRVTCANANGLTSGKRLVNAEVLGAGLPHLSCRWRKLGDRMRRKELATRRELVVRQLHTLADDLEELWKAATRDPVVEQRRERGWILLTGESPPGAKEPKEPSKPAPAPRDEVSAREG